MVAYSLARSRLADQRSPLGEPHDIRAEPRADQIGKSQTLSAQRFPVSSQAEQGFSDSEIPEVSYGEFLKFDSSGQQILRGARRCALEQAEAAVEAYATNQLDPDEGFQFHIPPIIVGKTQGFPAPGRAWKNKLGIHQIRIGVQGTVLEASSLKRFEIWISIKAEPIPNDPESPRFKQRETFGQFLALIPVPDAAKRIPAGEDARHVG